MKTVVQVVQHLRPGGIETLALDLQTFKQPGTQHYLISLEGRRRAEVAAWPRLKPFANALIFLDKAPGFQPTLVLKLRHILKQIHANVVHTHHIGPLIYAGLASRLAGIKALIHTEHDAWYLQNPHQSHLRKVISALTQPILVADAEVVAAALRKNLKTDNIRVIRNGIDTEKFRPGSLSKARHQLHLPYPAKLIGCCGRLEKVKGHDILIDALFRCTQQTHLALAGQGSAETALRDQVSALGLQDRVHFLGRVDHMPSFYHAIDLFVLPSRCEGMPLAPLEAQACGVKTIVTRVGAAEETLCPNTGRLVEKNNAKLLADSIKCMLAVTSSISPRLFVQQKSDVRLMAQAYAALHSAEVLGV